MRILVDENMTPEVCEVFRAAGHRVDFVSLFHPGLKDPEVLMLAENLRAIIVTSNHKDFVKQVSRRYPPNRPPIRHAGLVSLLSTPPDAEALRRALPLIELEFKRRGTMDDKRVIAVVETHHIKLET